MVSNRVLSGDERTAKRTRCYACRAVFRESGVAVMQEFMRRYPFATVVSYRDGIHVSHLPVLRPCDGGVDVTCLEGNARRYGASDGRLVLIQPDGYLGFPCRAEEAPLLETHLANLLTL